MCFSFTHAKRHPYDASDTKYTESFLSHLNQPEKKHFWQPEMNKIQYNHLNFMPVSHFPMRLSVYILQPIPEENTAAFTLVWLQELV